MSKLDALTTVQADEAPVITIFSDAGYGKTSMGALFPSPIFLTAEKGLQAIPQHRRPKAFPNVEESAQIWEYLTLLMTQEHSFQTLVIDTVTSIDALFRADILKGDKAETMNRAAGGYGGGYDLLAGLHYKLRKYCERLRSQLGMGIVFLSHATVAKLDPPDSESYTKYTVPLHEKSRHPYINDADVVAFIQLKKLVKSDDGRPGKARDFGIREVVCHAVASNDSKNRFGITEAIEYVDGLNPFATAIPYYRDNFPELTQIQE